MGVCAWDGVGGRGGGEEGRIKLNPLMFFLLVYISRRDIMLVFFGLFDCIISLQSRIVMNKNETEEQMPKTVKMSGHPFIAFLLSSHVSTHLKLLQPQSPASRPAPFITNSLDNSCPALPPSVLPHLVQHKHPPSTPAGNASYQRTPPLRPSPPTLTLTYAHPRTHIHTDPLISILTIKTGDGCKLKNPNLLNPERMI